MKNKIWNHDITATDTARDFALVICDIYANTNDNDTEAMETILKLCEKITTKQTKQQN